MTLKDKVVRATGAASGIGKAVAIRCANEGATVAVADLEQVWRRECGGRNRAFGRVCHAVSGAEYENVIDAGGNVC